MKILTAAAAAAILAGTAAEAATLNYVVDLRFAGDAAEELAPPGDTGTVCRPSDGCYPEGYRLPSALGGVFNDLVPGDVTTARFTVEDDGSATCAFPGLAECGSLSRLAVDSASRALAAEWIGFVPETALQVDLAARTVDFFGEAGAPFDISEVPCELDDPFFEGLPRGFCNVSGYRARFEVLSVSVNGVPQVPLPAPAALLLAGLFAIAAAGRRRRG